VHVVKDGKETKIWLNDLSIAVNLGYTAKELNDIIRKTREERDTFLDAWRRIFEHDMTLLQIEIEDSRPVQASCDATHVHVTLADGRTISAPLWWYPRLANAHEAARQSIELLPMGLHWPDIDENLSIASILRGQRAPGAIEPEPKNDYGY
jgi:hypothetical protein